MAIPLYELLRAAGEPTRLRILNLLRHRSLCVCDLQLILEIPQSTVSRHLAALRHADLVRDERNGQRVLYALAPATTRQGQALLRLMAACAKCEEVFRSDSARLRRALREDKCA
jgi:ArsR family transcriptional regulator